MTRGLSLKGRKDFWDVFVEKCPRKRINPSAIKTDRSE
jgi:hypothetical protein